MKLRERIERIARVRGIEPTPNLWLEPEPGSRRVWRIVGHAGGGVPLPGTGGSRTLVEALDAAEAWFAPELSRIAGGSTSARDGIRYP